MLGCRLYNLKPQFVAAQYRAFNKVRCRQSSVISNAAKSVLVPIGDGSEEMEAVIIIDVLRRAGAEVTVASVSGDLTTTASRQVTIVADKLIEDVKQQTFDAIALPGGVGGAESFASNELLISMIKEQQAAGRVLSAICASPALVLAPNGLLDGKKATTYPSFADKLPDQSRASDIVVQDGATTTSQGPATAFEFALSLVLQLFGREVMQSVSDGMLYKHNL